MISLKNNFIFIHVPKTAGNSIQNLLLPYAEDKIVCNMPYQDGIERFELSNKQLNTTKHSTLMDYKKALLPEIYRRLNKFCCVRNPWERALSFYFSPHRGISRFNRQEFIAFVKTIPPIVYYLREHEGQSTREAAANMNKIIRFENLQYDFRCICKHLNLTCSSLPHLNRTDRGKLDEYYDSETKDLIRYLFHEEITLFEYEFPEQ